jgi:glycine cleavage system H protein
LVFVELPEAGTSLTGAEKLGSVESVKAVSDIISPVSGEVIETNSTLADAPETVRDLPPVYI